MTDQKLSKTIRAASAVNLRYSANLMNLGRDYLKAISGALTQPDEPSPVAEQPTAARPPLLLAGHNGEDAQAAFAVNPTTNMQGPITLRIDGEFADSKLRLDPPKIKPSVEGQQIVRVIARIGAKTKVDQDYVGGVVIDEMNHRVTDFVLRRMRK